MNTYTSQGLTEQSIFDTVVAHLRAQGKKSEASHKEYFGCAYRGEKGTKCAAGCLIPDDIYDPLMERINFSFLTPSFPQLNFLMAFSKIISSLQKIHDTCRVEDWEKFFQNVAKDYKLVYTPRDSE